MLNRNFALALAAAMVLAALYGCSSNSGIKRRPRHVQGPGGDSGGGQHRAHEPDLR